MLRILIALGIVTIASTAAVAQTIDCNSNWLAFKKLTQHRAAGVCHEKSGLESRDQTAEETARAKANRERNLANR